MGTNWYEGNFKINPGCFLCVCVCGGGGGGGGLNPPAHACLDFGNIILIWPTEIPVKIITYHKNFRSTVKIMVLNVRLK